MAERKNIYAQMQKFRDFDKNKSMQEKGMAPFQQNQLPNMNRQVMNNPRLNTFANPYVFNQRRNKQIQEEKDRQNISNPYFNSFLSM